MTERTLGAVRKRLRAGQRACWMVDSSHGGCGRRRRGRARRGLLILKIGRVLELVFRPRHFQLDVARVVRVACRSVVVVTAGIDRDSVECAHVNGDVLCANAEEPAYAYDHANYLAGPVK